MNHKNKESVLLPLVLFFCLSGAPQLLAAEQAAPVPLPAYIFGVFPFLAQPTLEGIFSPIAAELATALKRKIHYQSEATFERFTVGLELQQYDIAHIQPFDYVQTAIKAGYLPLVTRTEMLSAIFLVKPESPLHSAKDLRGKKIGLPTKVAAVSYLARVALLQAKLDKDVTLRYFTTHQACLQALLIGDIDSCAAGQAVKRVFKAQTQRPLRVILTSPEIPQTLFVVHQRVPSADRQIIKKTLLATRLNNVEPKLRTLFHPDADFDGTYFRSVTDQEYDIVRDYLKMVADK